MGFFIYLNEFDKGTESNPELVFTRDFMCMFIELYLQPTLEHGLLVFRMVCCILCLDRPTQTSSSSTRPVELQPGEKLWGDPTVAFPHMKGVRKPFY